MDPSQLLERLARVPTPELTRIPAVLAGVDDSVRYLSSDAARRSIEWDVYWPKWHAPWWHMLLLFELGEARRIPEAATRWMLEGLKALKLQTFPFSAADLPPGADIMKDSLCHCAVGCIYSVLAATGVDVDAELPWIEQWFFRYQLADGGLNCDNGSYLVQGEVPSSMVATLAPLEAMLLESPANRWSSERTAFVDRAGAFLVERRLVLGSRSRHNADERAREPIWRQPCFPRFYFYDVVRGLRALTRWVEARQAVVPLSAVEEAAAHLLESAPDGVVRLQRRAFEGPDTRVFKEGQWTWHPATSFPLLEAVSVVGDASPSVTQQWSEARRSLMRLLDAKQIVA
jgi:hypothetical protein